MSQVRVSNLPFSTKKEDFEAFVQKAAGLTKTEFQVGEDGRPSGRAVLTFDKEAQADAAVKLFNDAEYEKRKLVVIKLKPPRTQNGKQEPRSNGSNSQEPSANDLKLVAKNGALFVSNLPDNTTKEKLRNFFEQKGEVKDCSVLIDRDTNQSKNVGFVSFVDPQVALRIYTYPRPHVLEGKTLRLFPKTTVDKEQTKSTGSKGGNLIFISSQPLLKEEAVRQHFGSFGEIRRLALTTSRDAYLVQYSNDESAQAAIKKMHDKTLAGYGKVSVRTGAANKEKGNENKPQKKENEKPKVVVVGQHELANIRFFEAYIKSSQSWVKRKKGQKDQDLQRELLLQTEAKVVSSKVLTQNLEIGAQYSGKVRAKLLELWNTLIQDSDKPDSWSFREDDGSFVSFRQVFVASKVVETLAMTAVDYPFRQVEPEQAESDSEAENEKPQKKVPDCTHLVLKIFSHSLIGNSKLHQKLVSTLDSLSTASRGMNVPLRVKQLVGDFFGSFKIDLTDPEIQEAKLVSLSGKNIHAYNPKLPTPVLLKQFEEKWSTVLALAGASTGGVKSAFEELSEAIHQYTSSQQIEDYKKQIAAIDDDIETLNDTCSQKLTDVDEELAGVNQKIDELNQQRSKYKTDLIAIVDELNNIQDQQLKISDRKSRVLSQHTPLLREIEIKKDNAAQTLAQEEASKAVLVQTSDVLDKAHAFLSAQLKNSQKSQKPDLEGLVGSSIEAATQRLNELFEEIKKQKKRAEFCQSKLASLNAELHGVRLEELNSVAQDLQRSVEKLTVQLQSITGDIHQKIGESEKVHSWIVSLKETGAIKDEDARKIAALHTKIEKVKI